MHTWAMQSLLLLTLLSSLTACGQATSLAAPTIVLAPVVPPRSQSTPIAAPQAVATPTPPAAASPAAAPMPTFLPKQRISVTLNGRTWHLAQPVGVAPLVAQGSAGILWIGFPLMRVAAPPAGDGQPRPLDAYFVMYTPLTEPGDDLGAAGYRIAPLASETDDAARSLIALASLEHNRFLLVSRRLCQGCQNGGTLEFWRIDPAQYGQPESFVSLIELPDEGGGYFLTFAISPRWLMWSAADLADLNPATPARHGAVNVLDLQSGHRRSITIDEPYGVEQAQWGPDGRFHLTMRQTQHLYVLDPRSGRITRAAAP